MLSQGRQIFSISDAARQAYIQVRLLFPEREVVSTMHAEGENIGIVRENGCSAIALMHIQVDYGDPPHNPELACPHGCDRQIVQYGEAGTKISVCVVGAACEVGSEPMPQGELDRQDRAGTFQHRAPDELGFPHLTSEANSSLGGFSQGARHHTAVVGLFVHGQEPLVGRPLDRPVHVRLRSQAQLLEVGVQILELPHREAVLRRPRAAVAGVVHEGWQRSSTTDDDSTHGGARLCEYGRDSG
mmetsp:Transcript_71496/g.205077  ORF Transcript_71496/g.205077 Transcript_71496/m.205077 type:complete len:243 (+) Transcript_71496:297-1025(+)